MAGEGGLVLDASVLIDYVARDKDLLALVSAHIAPIVIPLHVLAEVDGLDEAEAIALGMTVCVPADDQVDEAMDRPRGLSFEDYLCFATARIWGSCASPTTTPYGLTAPPAESHPCGGSAH